MKTITAIFLVLFVTAGFSNLQSQTILKPSKFSISVQGGGFLPMSDASDIYNTGGIAGIGLNYKAKKNIEVYLDADYNFINYKSTGVFDGSPSIFDIKAGGRFFFGNGKYRTFVEGGPGIYMFKTPSLTYTTSQITGIQIDPKTHDTTYTYSDVNTTIPSQTTTKFGIHAGLGETFNIAKNIDLYLKSDYNIVFTSGSTTMYFGILAGAKFGF